MPRKKKEPEAPATIPETAPPEPARPSESAKRVSAWVDKMQKSKSYKGKAQIVMASDARTPYYLRRPTGVLGLDIELGGGFHAGGGVQIHGAESVGKTHVAFRTCGLHQRIYGYDAAVLVYGTEIRVDKGFARKSGFCVAYSDDEITEFETIRVAQGFPAFTDDERTDLRKQIGQAVFLAADTADTGLDVVVEALKSNAFHIVVIESLGALLPREVEEGSVGDQHYGGSSKVLTTFQNMIYPLFMLDREDGTMLETTLIGINQARAEIGGGPRGPKTRVAAGAYAWKHGQLVSLELNRGADIKLEKDGPVVGKEVRWKLTKGKAGTHDGKKGEFNYYHLPRHDPVFWKDVENSFMGGIDIATEAVETAKRLELLEVAGSWISWEYEPGKHLRKQGGEEFANELVDNAQLMAALREQCIKKSGVLVRYR